MFGRKGYTRIVGDTIIEDFITRGEIFYEFIRYHSDFIAIVIL